MDKKKKSLKKEKKGIHKDMTIAEILDIYPSSTDMMMSHGLHCVGCGMRGNETLQEGCYVHGMTDQEIEGLIEDLNAGMQEEKIEIKNGISITQRALQKIKELQTKEKKKNWPLQIEWIDHADGEREFFIDFIKKPLPFHKEISFQGITLLFAKDTFTEMKGLQIDYKNNGIEEGFSFLQINDSLATDKR